MLKPCIFMVAILDPPCWILSRYAGRPRPQTMSQAMMTIKYQMHDTPVSIVMALHSALRPLWSSAKKVLFRFFKRM